MLKIDQEWTKGEYADTRNVEYRDANGSLFYFLISRYKNGQQKVVLYEEITEGPKLSDLSLAAIVAEALYTQIGDFTLFLQALKLGVEIDSSIGIEGKIMAGVAEALRKGHIALF